MDIDTKNVNTFLFIPGGEYFFTWFLKVEGLHPYIPSYTYNYWDHNYDRKLKDIEFVLESFTPA